jgi:SH3-like domain-containing protein
MNFTRRRIAKPKLVLGLLAAALGAMVLPSGVHGAPEPASKSAALPVPRFVSLKSDRVNVRGGPTKDHDVTWVYTRSGLPVEITAEFENWRRIRDWEGAEGWVYHSLLSGRRTAVVVPKSKGDLVPVMAKADGEANVSAKLEAGVVGTVKNCSGNWCHFTGDKFDGWIRQERLWGVYPNETVD